jgi:hypothetical protein
MEARRAFAEGVGYKGDIMDGVVTECAGGAIEEIHWRKKQGKKSLDGTLPVGDLNMPGLLVLDLSSNRDLRGGRKRERERGREREALTESYSRRR